MLGLWSIIGEQNASRKFVDLIWRSSSKYAPFDPSVASIEVGDYGTVDPKTGCFEKEGNIFSNEAFKPLVKGLSTKTLPLAQNQFMVVSLNAKQADADVSAKLDAARIAHAQFKCGWHFGKESGAVLVAVECRSTRLPPDLNIKDLANHDTLHKKSLVTNVTTSLHYALYLACKGDSGIYLALCGQGVPGEPGASLTWEKSHGTGCFRSNTRTNDEYPVVFELKFCTKTKKGLFRDSPPPTLEKDGVAALEDTIPPWGSLDDDGNEEEGTDKY